MNYYRTAHPYYCGVDLHARTMYAHVLDADGKTVFEEDLPAEPAAFLGAVRPFRAGPGGGNLVVGAECMFAWYWLADLCEDERIPFVLGHALAMKAVHGGKAKNDRADAAQIAGLLRGGLFPQAYVYPRAQRATRDLLRRRSFFVRQRAQLIAHLQNGNAHLKWAFSEAASLMLRSFAPAKSWMKRQEKKRTKKKAHAILEAKLGRAVFHLWRRQVPFDAKRFLAS